MFATTFLFFMGILCISSVISERVICDLEDSNCLTKSSRLTFEKFVSGIPGVESSETLYAKLIEGNHPELSYKFIDAKLSGMKNCQIELVKISTKDLKYLCHLGCPLVTLEAKYVMNGSISTLHVEGKGDARIDFYDILFVLHGDYVRKAGAEGKDYINLKTYKMDLQVKGKLYLDFKNLYDGDKEKSDVTHKAANANWEPLAKAYSKETLQPFMDKYISNSNAYLDVVNVQDLFSYEK